MIRSPPVEFPNKKTIIHSLWTGYQLVFLDSRPDPNCNDPDCDRIEKQLNNRPRKCLNYKTPDEMFRLACGALTG